MSSDLLPVRSQQRMSLCGPYGRRCSSASGRRAAGSSHAAGMLSAPASHLHVHRLKVM